MERRAKVATRSLTPIVLPVTPAEDFSDSEEFFPKEISKWNSNDLMDKIESADEAPGMAEPRRSHGPGAAV